MKPLAAVLAAPLCLTVGCGSTEPGPRAPNNAAETPAPTRVEPLQVHRQPKSRAIILGTTDDGGSTEIPLTEDQAKVEVDVMWVSQAKPRVGGSSPTTLYAEPQNEPVVRVGVFEQFSGGMGSQSRSSVWIASFLAASTLGRDLTDFKFSAEVGGFVDGPSAGGLYTAGYLAALTGTSIDPSATMTGTVNPDGTIGPVSGIPQKFIASIKKGKKRLGYPVGLGQAKDANTGELVDLQALAKEHGATAREIRDIYEAYALMTGKELPRPVPLAIDEMKLDEGVAAAFRQRLGMWSTLRSQQNGKVESLSSPLPVALTKILEVGKAEARAAERSLEKGLPATAYWRNVEATVHAVAAAELAQILSRVQLADVEGARKLLRARVQSQDRIVAAMDSIGTRHPHSIGGHLLMISAFQKGTAAVGFGVWGIEAAPAADQFLRGLKGKPAADLSDKALAEELVRKLSPAVLNFTRGEAMAIAAQQSLAIEATQTIDYSCSEPAARKLAESYSSAALANLRYFESITLKEVSRSTGLPEARARLVLGRIEPDYVTASAAMRMALGHVPFIANLKEKWGEESLAWSLQSLSGAILSYFKSSLLISRWYSLGIKRDRQTGKATSVEHEKAFANMLESAERSAREHAHAAKVAVGHVPIQARIEYQKARILRDGSTDEKLRALEGFWASSSYSQTAVAMARQVINPAKHGAYGR